jgi:uncharacterized protein YjbI with pentapeptide repeats
MIRILSVLTIILVFGFCTEVFSKTSKEKYPHPIFIPFEHNCTGNYKGGKKPSNGEILQILEDHSKWLKNPKAPDGYRANFCEADLGGALLNDAMLAGANFAKAKLHNAQFHKAQQNGSNLTRANFTEAQLQGANLDYAMLHLAILKKAKLQKTQLKHANLTRANFSEAQLQGANLDYAMLYQTNLQGANLTGASLKGANLRNVKGLTQNQINMACMDQQTNLPPGLSRPKPCS